MLNPEQFEKIKHKRNPSMQDVAVLIVTVEQLLRRNEIQASELKKSIKACETLNKRVEWYRVTTVKDVSHGS